MVNEYVEAGVPFIRSQNINPFRLNLSDIKYITIDFHTKLKKSALRPGDVAVVRTGYPGTACVIPKTLPSSNCADLVVIRPGEEINAHFLVAVFNSTWGRGAVAGNLVGVAQQHFNVGAAKELVIDLPPIATQTKIAGILSAYDDLIENNTRRIAILEEMAQAIYREWFVHFRFPGHEQVRLVDSQLGKIPEGWKVGVINDAARLLSGFAFKSETFVDDGEYRLVTIKNVHDGRFVEESDSLLDALPDKMPDHCHLSSGDLLLSLTGNIGRTCIVYGSGLLLNQRVAKLSPLNAADKGYVYCLFRSPETQVRLSNIANGVAQQNLSPVQTGQLPHALPPRALLDAFADMLTPTIGNIVQLYRKNSNLRKTRDLLLPKLISGQLDVEELDIDPGQPQDAVAP
jgi:type I restriction enzyme S subunit